MADIVGRHGGKAASRAHLELEPIVRVHADLVVLAQRRQQRAAVGQVQAERLADRSRLGGRMLGFRACYTSALSSAATASGSQS